MKSCPKCHQVLPDDALFCPIDGTSLAKVAGDPLLGSVIGGRYVLLERVGEGNSGTIYRGEHVVLRQKIAVKLLHPELSRDEKAVERFRNEAATLAQLDNHHIVKVSDFGVAEDGRVFFAMEYLDGETLAERIGRAGKLAEPAAVAVLQQVGGALAEAHQLGFVHRDMRPRNIFLCDRKDTKDVVKLLDFGLAKLVEAPKGARTTLGTSVGDPRYMSPEQARGDLVDLRSDLYSLALIGYEMVTGAPPFVGAGTFDVLTKHLEAQPVAIRQKAPGISDAYAAAIMRGLSKQADDRFKTVEEFLAAVTGAAPSGKPAATASSAISDPPPPLRKPAAEEAFKPGLDQTIVDVGPPASLIRNRPQTGNPDFAPAKTILGVGLTAADVARIARESQAAAAAAATAPEDEATLVKQPSTAKISTREVRKRVGLPPASDDENSQPVAGVSVADNAGAGSAGSGPVMAASDSVAAKLAASQIAKNSVSDSRSKSNKKKRRGGSNGHQSVAPAQVPGAKAAQAGAGAAQKPGATGASGAVANRASQRGAAGDMEVEEYDASSQSGSWFAEGVAAEKELKSSTDTGPLPSIYDAIDEEPVRRRIPPVAIVGAVVVAFGVFLILFLVVFNDKKSSPKPSQPKLATVVPKDENALPVPGEVAKKVTPQPQPAAKAPVKAATPAESESKPAATVSPPQPKESAAPKVVAKKEALPPPSKTAPVSVAKRPETVTKPHAAVETPNAKPRIRPAPTKSDSDKGGVAGTGIGRDPLAAATHVREGQLKLRKGSYTPARKDFADAIDLDPKNADAYAGLGEVAFELGNYAQAVQHLKNANSLSRGNSRFQTMLGNAYFKLGKTREAIQQYRAALKRSPNNAAARTGLEAAIRRQSSSGG